LVAICSPNKGRGNTRLIYKVLSSVTTKKPYILGA
jgi:hypothetical protein